MSEELNQLREIASELRSLTEQLESQELTHDQIGELIRKSAELSAEAGSQLERALRSSDRT